MYLDGNLHAIGKIFAWRRRIMRTLILVFLLFISVDLLAQNVEVVKFDQVEKVMKAKSNKLRIFNFWATWCKPCIIEMPFFEEIAESNKNKIELNFMSVDYADQVESKVKPFLNKKNIKSRVMVIDDLDYNSWIDRVDPRWSGAIPATVFITPSGKKVFFEKEFKKEELKNLIDSLLNE